MKYRLLIFAAVLSIWGTFAYTQTSPPAASTTSASTDDAAYLNGLIARCSSGTVHLPAGVYNLSSGVVVPAGGPRIVIDGGSVTLRGSGITLLSIARSGTVIRDLTIVDSNPAGGDTVGIDISNGVAGVNNFALENVWVLGQNSTGDGSLAKLSKSGTGIRCTFALKGRISGCVVEGWNAGLQLGKWSNANEIAGTKLRVNTRGLDVLAGVDDVFLTGNTIEGNSTGVCFASRGQATLASNHFENTLGEQTNVRMLDGWLVSTGNFFAGAAKGKDIVIDAGNPCRGTSRSDLLNSGVTAAGKTFLVDRSAW